MPYPTCPLDSQDLAAKEVGIIGKQLVNNANFDKINNEMKGTGQ